LGDNATSFSGNSSVSNNMFIDNQNSGGGMFYSMKKTNFTKNHVIDNNASCGVVIANYGAMSYNTITRNKNSGCNMTVMNGDSMSLFNFNNIYGNKNVIAGQYYEYRNAVVRQQVNSPIMNAENNWWGTTIVNNIDSLIYDYYDDTSYCKVDYVPFLTNVDTIAPVTPVRNVVKTNLGGGNVQVTWTANPEPDIAGYKIYWGNPTGYSFSNYINVGAVASYTLTSFNFNDTIAVTAYDTQADDTADQCQCHESWYTYDNYYYGTGVSENNIQQFIVLIYPNPFSTQTVLQTDNSFHNATLTVDNCFGQTVAQMKNISGQTVTFSRGNLPCGMYFIQLTEGSKTLATGKVIITND